MLSPSHERESPQLESLVARLGVPRILHDEGLITLGRITLGGKIPGFPGGSEPKTVELSEEQRLVALFASFGGTTEQVARLLVIEQAQVETIRDEFIAIYDVRNMAAVINQQIIRDHLPVAQKRRQGSSPHIPTKGRTILRGIARGDSNTKIGERLHMSRDAVRSFSKALFVDMNVNGRTHSVRGAYELGVKISNSPPRRLNS